MPLVFSPLTEDVLDKPPKKLLPKYAFIMRQLGDPSDIDLKMASVITAVFKKRGFKVVDANDTVGSKDYLERILGLIRGTGFTVAVFSDQTRANSLANIALELGYAAMCGKPLIITQSKGANAPSDLKRTDYIEYDFYEPKAFETKLGQALDEIVDLTAYESDLLDVALNAAMIDCGVAFERANKAFLLSGEKRFIDAAKTIGKKIPNTETSIHVTDLERLRQEIETFVMQAERAISALKPKKERQNRKEIVTTGEA